MLECDHRRLRKSPGRGYPSRVIFLDVETTQHIATPLIKHTMKMGWTCFTRYNSDFTETNSSWKFWDDTQQLQTYINDSCHNRTTTYLVGHNIFFDLQSSDFFHFFTQFGWILNFYYDEGLTYILIARRDKATIKVISTTNFFATSLKKLGEMLNFPKLDVKFDDVSDDDLSIYCKRDVEITKKIFEQYVQFIIDHDLGKFCLTRSSQSFTSFTSRFMAEPIYLHNHIESIELEREGYFGGRTECFALGEIPDGPFVTLDVNSMYPYVMSSFEYPKKLINYYDTISIEKVTDIVKTFAVMSEVDIETDEPAYAVRRKNKIIFPIGRFRTVLCTTALNHALQHKHIKNIHRTSVFQKSFLFNDFVDYFYDLRQEYSNKDNMIYSQMIKIMLNSLYGKFAQMVTATKEQLDLTRTGYYSIFNVDITTGKQFKEYKLLNRIVQEGDKTIGSKSFIAISAHITENARMFLWNIIKMVGREKVLYCDTDSIKVRKKDIQPINHLLHDSFLGSLKTEDESEHLWLLGLKSYATEHKRVLKGIPKKALEISPGRFVFDSFSSQKTHLREQITRFFIARKIEKNIECQYDKGIVNDDNSISPLTLSEF